MKTLITILLFVVGFDMYGQTVVKGKITDEKGELIPGANVFLQDTYDGSTSGIDGSFEFTSTEIGNQTLVVKFVGYKDFSKEIILNKESVNVLVILKESISELDAVTISAGSFTASDESRRTIFKALDIATTAGATADIAGALNTLPGTQKVGETGRLFVRGGDDNEARTFIDGMLVLNPYNSSAPNTPSRGRFLPFMFKGTSFSTGGYSAEYGQALSSTLVLDSKDQAEYTRTDFGLLSVGADVTHTQVWDKSSIAGKIQYTNISPYYNLISQEIDWEKPFVSAEGIASYRQEIGKNGMFKAYGNVKQTRYSLYQHDIDNPSEKVLYDLTNKYHYTNLSYKGVLNDKWIVRGGYSYSSNKDDSQIDNNGLLEEEKGHHGKIIFEGSLSDRVEFKTGGEVIDRDYDYQVDDGDKKYDFHEVITSAFVEGDIYLSQKFVTRVGGRLEHNSLSNHLSVDPRISLAYKAGKGNFSLAYGKFRQSPVNQLLRLNTTVDEEKADHYILNYQLIENKRTFRAEIYYKKYDDLIKYTNPEKTIINNDGFGYAKGFELFWRDNQTINNFDYWVSYSYLDTKRNYIDFPYQSIPTFASAHNFSVVGKYFFTKLKSQVGATYSFTSGRPYNNPNEEKFNAGKTKSYQDLSLNIAYLPRHNVIIYFSATNLLGRDNIFGYEYGDALNEEGLYNSRAIRQPAKRFLFVGIFITLSKEKSINQLPSL